jgi:hypothetical protein
MVWADAAVLACWGGALQTERQQAVSVHVLVLLSTADEFLCPERQCSSAQLQTARVMLETGPMLVLLLPLLLSTPDAHSPLALEHEREAKVCCCCLQGRLTADVSKGSNWDACCCKVVLLGMLVLQQQ